MVNSHEVEYAGFWRRFLATLIDSLFFAALTTVLLYVLYGGAYFDWLSSSQGMFDTYDGWDGVINNLLPLLVTLFFWVKFMGTPGKLLLGCQVLDARTLQAVTLGQALLRYVGYFVSILTLGLGFFWIAWDSRKQGFHDKIAKTIVVHEDEFRVSYKELDKGDWQ